MNWMCIDPGISGTGIAFFRNEKLLWWDNFYPKGKDWKEKVVHADTVFSVLFLRLKPVRVFIEWPTGRFLSKAGLAAQNTDGMLKLSYLIGRLSGWIGYTILVPVIKWKGNLPKEITQKRAERFFKIKGFKNHAADAVGMGQYVIENNLIEI